MGGRIQHVQGIGYHQVVGVIGNVTCHDYVSDGVDYVAELISTLKMQLCVFSREKLKKGINKH